ncbi:NAD-dependent epimerase/dehydratase family protein [Synechococcus sp. GEYO]|uniref:NAD-dependent epimerase/dehydratase family protein n=1 Tax=Synechococcus sp. GEYO TaxID=2575511 RepID=UPI001A7E1791|nr:NAD-dependent epimerase/dehydratase family protein [Synechococcus sp. GEYO]
MGGGGYLGSILVEYFLNQGQQILNISRSFQFSHLPAETRIVSAVGDCQNYINQIKNGSILIYMAGSTNIEKAQSFPDVDLTSHLSEMKLFFEVVRQNSVHFRKIIFFSSAGAVYGDSNSIRKDETSAPCPKSIYGKRNLLLEDTFRFYAELLGFNYCVLRISNPYGPTQRYFRRKGLIQALLLSAKSGNNIILRGNGLQKRDYIEDRDFCYSVFKVSQLTVQPPVINICSAFSLSALDVINILEQNGIHATYKISDLSPQYEVKDSLLSNKLLTNILECNSIEFSSFANSLHRLCDM